MAEKRLKLLNVYHGTYNDIDGDLRPSTNPDRSLYGPGVYATDKKGSARYGSRRVKMQINPKNLETVGPASTSDQQDKKQKTQETRKKRKN